jgi:hypothetical protein
MANPRLTSEQLALANDLLNNIRQRLDDLSQGDRDAGAALLFELGDIGVRPNDFGSIATVQLFDALTWFGPNLVATNFTSYWVYVAGPLVGAVLAVGAAWVLRGAGGGRAGSGAAQGDLFTEVERPDRG